MTLRIQVHLDVRSGDHAYALDGVYRAWGEVFEAIGDFFANCFDRWIGDFLE